MKNENKLKALDLKVFIIPLIIITAIYFISDIILIDSIKNHYYTLVTKESEKHARSYSHNLTKATEASEIVNELLNEKLLMASKTAAMYDGRHSNKLLAELADTLKVNEIYSYNSQGEIVYSNTGKYIGWKAYEGHPVYDFMISDKSGLVEDIRQDTETGIYYKYGYFKAPDGNFVQIGVLADKIQNFLGRFEIQQLIDDSKEDRIATQICFIDNDFNVIGSTNHQFIGKEMTNQEAKAAILINKEYSFINNIDGEDVYEVFIPVYSQDSKIGTLYIGQSLKETDMVVRQVSIIGLLSLTIIYFTLLYTMIYTYKKNKKLIKLAYYDSLTDLPNIEYLKVFLTDEIEKHKCNGRAIFLINCSNFKTINLTFGFQYGDKILQELANKLKKLSNSYKMIFKFTADRFILYVDNYETKNELIELINKISEVFNNPFRSKEVNQFIELQIGVVEIDNKYDGVDRLLKNASISLTHIKDNNSVNYAFFNEEMENQLQREEMIERELRTAILENDTKKIYLEYQPQVDLRTNRIVGFEALARMRTESLGFVSPIEFIDIAERKQLIVPLGNLILKTACNFIRTLNFEGYDDVKVAVNISGIQLLWDDFADTVMAIIKETGIKYSNLELEITESVFLDNFEVINKKLKNLRDNKIKISIDDFGTGYSSLCRLEELNVDTLKVDKYFISKVSVNKNNEHITGDIIFIAHKFGLAVVAEGVELQIQKEYIIENDCDIMQGYLFSKPLLEEKAIEMLKNQDIEIE